MGLQARQVGADNTALMTGVVCVQLDVMDLKVVLIQQCSLLKARFTDTAEIGLV